MLLGIYTSKANAERRVKKMPHWMREKVVVESHGTLYVVKLNP